MTQDQYTQLLQDMVNKAVGYAEGRNTLQEVIDLINKAKEEYAKIYRETGEVIHEQ